MKILLIAGHGHGDPGAVAKIGGTTYREENETRRMVNLLLPRLEKAGIEATAYNQDYNAFADHKTGSLLSRAKFENYDYVLELHMNAFLADPGNGKTKGVEIYVTTKEKGAAVEEAIVRNIAAIGFANRGVKRKDFTVIAAAKKRGTSSALLELCFIDDYDDMSLYTKKRAKVADAIVAGIVEGFGLKAAPVKTEKTTQAETSYKVKVTAELLNVRKGAGTGYAISTTVQKGEVYTIVEMKGSWGKLKSGAGWICLDYTTKC